MRLNPYKVMWLYVMFDLPVVETEDRKEATKFRQFLLDKGFIMAKYSVYYKFAGGSEQQQRLLQQVKQALPPKGRIDVLTITDIQYANIVSYSQHEPSKEQKSAKEDPLLLF
ncbi:MAG: CRISPR-associated endonuclease Cas2 [Spirochaetota bacterium]